LKGRQTSYDVHWDDIIEGRACAKPWTRRMGTGEKKMGEKRQKDLMHRVHNRICVLVVPKKKNLCSWLIQWLFIIVYSGSPVKDLTEPSPYNSPLYTPYYLYIMFLMYNLTSNILPIFLRFFFYEVSVWLIIKEQLRHHKIDIFKNERKYVQEGGQTKTLKKGKNKRQKAKKKRKPKTQRKNKR